MTWAMNQAFPAPPDRAHTWRCDGVFTLCTLIRTRRAPTIGPNMWNQNLIHHGAFASETVGVSCGTFATFIYLCCVHTLVLRSYTCAPFINLCYIHTLVLRSYTCATFIHGPHVAFARIFFLHKSKQIPQMQNNLM